MPENLRELSDDQNPVESDLRASLMSAYDETPPDAPAEKPAKVAPVVTETKPVVAPDKTSSSPVRGDNGRFIPKTADAAGGVNEKPNDGTTGSDAAIAAVRNPPASWTPELKESWTRFDPAIQDFLLKRETESSKAIQERSERIKTYEDQARNQTELEKILSPRREKWALAGQSDHQQVQRLLAAQDLLNRDPAAGLRYLAQSYGLSPAQIFAAAQNQQAVAPNPLAAQLAQLEQRLAAREKAEDDRMKQTQEEQSATVQTEIDAFKADTAHPHFETVKADMSLFLANGRAATLQEAYDKAVRLDPTLSQATPAVSQGDAAAKVAAEAEKAAAAAKIAKARAASPSVRGGPTGSPVIPAKSSIRDNLLDAWVD